MAQTAIAILQSVDSTERFVLLLAIRRMAGTLTHLTPDSALACALLCDWLGPNGEERAVSPQIHDVLGARPSPPHPSIQPF